MVVIEVSGVVILSPDLSKIIARELQSDCQAVTTQLNKDTLQYKITHAGSVPLRRQASYLVKSVIFTDNFLPIL